MINCPNGRGDHNVLLALFRNLSRSEVLILEKSCPIIRVGISCPKYGSWKLQLSLSFLVDVLFSLLFNEFTQEFLWWSRLTPFVWWIKLELFETQLLLFWAVGWKLSDVQRWTMSDVEGWTLSELILGRLTAESVMTVSIISNVNICNLIISFRRVSFSA